MDLENITFDAVYFERKKMDIGSGHTSKVKFEEIHYYVRENDEGMLNVEVLSPSGRRTGVVVDVIDKETFLERFSSCYEHECSFFPKLSPEENKKKALMHAENGDKLKANNQMKHAEIEYGNALKFDESSARGNYGMAKVFLETGRMEKGKSILKKLSKLETVFEKENKHLFNEIGIDLRKQGLHAEALDHYNKAISIDPEDAGLYYNLARLHKETNEYIDALKAIKKALELNPDFKEGLDFQAWLEAKF